jgi:hypothetical protein
MGPPDLSWGSHHLRKEREDDRESYLELHLLAADYSYFRETSENTKKDDPVPIVLSLTSRLPEQGRSGSFVYRSLAIDLTVDELEALCRDGLEIVRAIRDDKPRRLSHE